MGPTDAQGQLTVRLLGDPEVRRGSSLVKAFESGRLQSLLAFLIVHRDRPIARQRLAFEFWPDSTDGQARTNLRQALHHLRHALGDVEHDVLADGRTVQWLEDGPADVDVVRFEAAARAGLATGDEQWLARAADEYRGDLLVGAYEEWLTAPRERLRSLAADVLRALADAARRRHDWTGATDVAERLVRLDPLDEASHRLLIEVHVAAGDRVRALRRYHECVGLLDRELGVAPCADTVALYEALVVGDPAGAGDVRRGLTFERSPLIGRATELDELRGEWRHTVAGQAGFALVVGEPGIGKSRLVEELLATCRQDGAMTLAARAYETPDAVPYGPMIEILRSAVLRPAVDALRPELRRHVARVLPDRDLDDEPVDPGGESDHRHQLFAAIAQVLVGSERPVLVAIDDLHWCHPDTFDLVEVVLRTATAAARPLLLVGTSRRDELTSRPPLRAAIARLHAAVARASTITLGRLDEAAAGALVADVAPAVPAATVTRIVGAADGNPLFLVEMARHGAHDGGADVALPPRVQAVIECRLDRLPAAAGELAAVAAVVGRSFTIDLVARLLDDELATMTGVDELWRRGILQERGFDGYDFSHDRIRDVAYQRIGPAHRRRLHGDVAAALEVLGGEPAQIAYHRERAGQLGAAIAAYRLAVDAAVRAFAHQEVIASCRRALCLVADRPAGPDRDDAELMFLVPLGVALMAGPGIADDDLCIFERARALRIRRGLAADPSTLRISANAAIERRAYVRARGFGETLLERGRDERDGILVTEGHYVLGVTSFWLGDLRASRRHLEAALDRYDASNTAVHLERFGQDPRAVCLVRLALTSYELGDGATAAACCDAALDAVADLDHAYTDVYVRIFAAWYHAERGDAARAAAVVAAGPATTNSTAPICRAQFTGWARTHAGDPAGGVPLLAEAVALARAGPLMFEPFALLQLAASRRDAGDPAGALADAERAREIAAASMPYHLPEALRLTGELHGATGARPAEVLRRLDAAARLAARHGAAVHELRARTALVKAAHAHERPAGTHEAALRACRSRLVAFDGSPDVAAADDVLAAR